MPALVTGGPSLPPGLAIGLSAVPQRAADDVVDIGRERGRGRNASERSLRPRPSAAFQYAPGAERRGEPRGELRILSIERQHSIGDEIVARAIGAVELGGVASAKEPISARTRLGLANEKAGCAVRVRTRSSVRAPGSSPEANHLSTTSGSSRSARRSPRARRCVRARPAATRSRARPCGRSCCRRHGIAASARDRVGRPLAAMRSSAVLRQRTASGGCGVRACRAAGLQACGKLRQAAAERVADRRAQRVAGAEDRIGIDVAADLARNVGLRPARASASARRRARAARRSQRSRPARR